MALLPIALAPGVNLTDSSYVASKGVGQSGQQLVRGTWISSLNVRFFNGLPQKRYGWVQLVTTGALRGIARSMRDWLGTDQVARTAIGTESGLFVLQGTTLTEITPRATLIEETSASINFATTNGSTDVVITSSYAVALHDWVFVSMSTAVGGIQLAGWVSVVAVGSGNYTVQSPVSASSTASTGIPAGIFYPRQTATADPITTTSGSAVISVSFTSGQGYVPQIGDLVTISGATPVGGINPNGTFAITGADSLSFAFNFTSNASSSATGGGSAIVVQFNITVPANPSYLSPGWTLSPYGGFMSACNIGGTIYFYDPILGGRAYPVAGAPTKINAHFVTPERFIVALGTSNSPLQMAWCDQQDPTDWVSTAANTANSGRNLIGGNYFLSGIAVSDGVSLIVTDRCTFLMQYTGDNEVYATPKIADNAGGVSPWCMAVLGSIAFWRGDQDFWMYGGSVQRIDSSVIHETVFDAQQYDQLKKCIVGTNRQWNEVWFYDVASGNSEIDRLTVYQNTMDCWTVEQDDSGPTTTPIPLRTAWMDSNLFSVPYAIDSAGTIFQQETGTDNGASGMRSSLASSVMDIGDGSQTVFVAGLVPDMAYLFGSLSVSIGTKYYPGDSEVVDATQGPIAASGSNYTNYLYYRADGKLFSFQFSSNALGDDWRMGQFRVELQPQGARR